MPILLTPWSLGSHQKIGGFDPLIRHWMRSQSPQVFFARPPWRHEIDPNEPDKVLAPLPKRSTGYATAFALPEVADFFDRRDLQAPSLVDGDFDLLHTVPLTLAKRPFIFICTSMVKLFTPFARPGAPTADGALDAIMPIYEALFASPACVAVLFHLKADLQSFARLFPQSKTKLHLQALTLPAQILSPIQDDRPPTLLFTTISRSGGIEPILGGGVMAIAALDRLRRLCPEARLIFAARDGRARMLNPSGQSEVPGRAAARALVERNLDHIVWVNDHLTEFALQRLMRSSDALVCAGAHADPLVLITAMTQGCIPIVSNMHGAAEWVTHGHTGVVLDMLDGKVLAPNGYGFTDTVDQAFYDGHDAILERTTQALDDWLPLIADKRALRRFQQDMAVRAEHRFQSLAGRRQIIELLGQTQGSGGGLSIARPVDFVGDFNWTNTGPIVTLADRQIVSAGGGFAVTALEPTRGGGDLYPDMPKAMAALVGVDIRSPEEILRDALAKTPSPSVSPAGMVEALDKRYDVHITDLSHRLWSPPETVYPEGGYIRPLEHGLAVLPNPTPWVYGFYLPLTPELLGDADWLVVSTGPTLGSFGLGLLNAAGDAFACRVQTPANKDAVEVWLPLKSGGELSALVLHNWAEALKTEVLLLGMKLVNGAAMEG